jgi:hypothetical protein
MISMDWEETGREFSRSVFAKMGWGRDIPGGGTRGPDGVRAGPTEKTGFFPRSSGLSDPHLDERRGGFGGEIPEGEGGGQPIGS